MKQRLGWLGAFVLAVSLTSQVETKAITNGVIIITTRTAQDAFWRQQSSSSLWDGDDAKGPGVFTPGDAAMGELLQDHGYTTRMLPEKVLTWMAQDMTATMDWVGNPNDPINYYTGGGGPSSTTSNVLWSAMLVIVSGSGSSADMPRPNTNGIPIIMGEHSCLGDFTTGVPRDHSELFLYSNKSSANLDLSKSPGLYMKVVAPEHPIMKGIPLDSEGRVKIFREPYPEETLFNAQGGKSNYEISWTAVDCSENKSVAAPGLTILGVLASNPNQSVFAVADAGAQLGDTSDPDSPWYGVTAAPSRLVHLFVNEGGSGNSRRAFNALTVWGRLIFLRTCKWAMGEELLPYESIRINDVTAEGNKVSLSWPGSVQNNYQLYASTDAQTWEPVGNDIIGQAGAIRRTLDISAGPQAVFLQVAALP